MKHASPELGFADLGQCQSLASSKVRGRIGQQWLNLLDKLLDVFGRSLFSLGVRLGKGYLHTQTVDFCKIRVDKEVEACAL